MSREPLDQRVTVMMTASELKSLDDLGFSRRIRSRGELVRRLLKAALDAGIEPLPSDRQKPRE